MFRLLALLAILTLGTVVHDVNAQGPSIVLNGEGVSSVTWDEHAFTALPHVQIKVKNSAGTEDIYDGVDLSVLLLAGNVPLRANLKGADISKYLHVQGADGFAAVIALPEFDDGLFLVADRKNGNSLAVDVGPFYLISPQEERHSRWIKQVEQLRIKRSMN